MGSCPAPLFDMASDARLVALKMEEQASNGEASVKVRSEIEESESVEMRPSFEKENYEP